jgi:ElaB/YqjD/DUF883 family membrane-anchored ribosome-binding protein
MSSSEQLERETEEERARISETLNELRARMTPGHVVDRLVDYANDSSGGMFFRNLRQQAVDNPVPVALVGAGLAWLAISGRRASTNTTSADNLVSRTTDKISAAGDRMADRARHAADNASDTARNIAGSMADTASSTYGAASELAGEATSRVQGATRSAVDTAAEAASTTYGAAADQTRRAADKLQKSASDLRGKAAASGRNFMDFVHEQPLVLVGLGLAIGAAIGAASPATEAEDELMGESSDALKEETADLAKKHLKKGEAVAERAWQSATEEAEKQGLVSSATESDAAVTAQFDPVTNEIPLVPSTETSTNPEDQRSEH